MGDFILEIATDLSPASLLGGQNSLGQTPQVRLQSTRFMEQFLGVDPALFQGFLGRLAADNALSQRPVGCGQVQRAPIQSLIYFPQVGAGLERGWVTPLDRGDGLSKEQSRPFLHLRRGAGGTKPGHGLLVNPGQIQDLQSEADGLATQPGRRLQAREPAAV